MKKKIIIAIIILVAIFSFLIATGALKINLTASVGDKKERPAENQATPTGQPGTGVETNNGAVSIDQINWKEYKSDKFGYKVSIPASWTIDEKVGQNGGPEILISEPKKFAFVLIRAFYDASVNSPENVEKSINAFQKSVSSQPGTIIEKFETGEIENNTGGFIYSGEFKISDVTFRFEEKGLLSTNGRILIFRSAAVKDKNIFDIFIPLMRKITESFTLE